MGRYLRPHLPGAPFHLTARLQGRKPLFVGLEQTAIRWIREEARRSGCDLLAFAIMPNHLHIVAAQGTRPLGEFMQPLLRRLALAIHRKHETEGHVFQRRFHSAACTDPSYLRSALAYVHLNPVKAGFCKDPGEYSWSSHAEYCSVTTDWSSPKRGTIAGLELFAPFVGASLVERQATYREFLEWRLFADSCVNRRRSRASIGTASPPPTVGGDIFWVERYGSRCVPAAEGQSPWPALLDLRDMAIRFLRTVQPELTLEQLRSGGRAKALVAVRRDFISRAKDNGHRHRAIARFLCVSDVTVSRS